MSLAKVSQRAENSVVGKETGLSDHIPSLLGEDNHALLFDSRSLDGDQVSFPLAERDLALLVIDTGVIRDVDLAAERFSEREEASCAVGLSSLRELSPKTLSEHRETLSEVTYRRAQHIVNENQRVLDAAKALRTDGPEVLGEILSASQASLRDDYDVSGKEIDLAVETCLGRGAYGARMIGLGDSGALYALVDESSLSLLQVALDGAFTEHGYQAPATYVVGPSRGALRH